jgi:hypothetical protein
MLVVTAILEYGSYSSIAIENIRANTYVHIRSQTGIDNFMRFEFTTRLEWLLRFQLLRLLHTLGSNTYCETSLADATSPSDH